MKCGRFFHRKIDLQSEEQSQSSFEDERDSLRQMWRWAWQDRAESEVLVHKHILIH